jgi:membrane protein DedA with SNARE-associated domain
MDSLVHTAVAALLSGGPHPVLPGFLNSLAGPLEHYGLWAILLLVLVEDFGIPVPGETVLIAGAVFAGSGQLNVVAVGVVGFVAAVAGDNTGYAIGRFGGRALVERWGRYVFLTAERLDKAQVFFDRHGGKIITIARFVEGLRQANGIIAGITEMHWLRFLAFNALGAALWVGTWVSVGYFAGEHITAIYDNVTKYSLYAAIAAVVLIAAAVAFRVLRKRRSSAPPAAAATADADRGADDVPGGGNVPGADDVPGTDDVPARDDEEPARDKVPGADERPEATSNGQSGSMARASQAGAGDTDGTTRNSAGGQGSARS